MPAVEVQGLPDFPSTPLVVDNAPEDQLLPVGRTHSQPIGESGQGPSYGKKSQGESPLNVLVPMPPLRPPLAADNTALEQLNTVPSTLQSPKQPTSAPSPVPTEIIPSDLTQEEIVLDIQQSGIKIRDFAYEPFPVELCAPELFDPILAWHVYEATLEHPIPKRSPLNGKHLRRLLDLGWVSEGVDGRRWQEKDREALEKFDSRPYCPWKALSLTKPKKSDLRGVAMSRFQRVDDEQLVPHFFSCGFSVAAVLRGSRHIAAARYQKRHATGTGEDTEVSSRLKGQ